MNGHDLGIVLHYAYNGWGNLIEEWQAHDSAVDMQTTPSVQYAYEDGASGSVAKYVRLSQVTYPNGREVHYDYAAGVEDVMSRLSNVGDGANTHASYKYLGAGRIVVEDYEDVEVKLSYLDGSGNVTGLDRFGRILDQIWTDYGANPDEILDHYSYTYDRAGNRTARLNNLNHDLDETYNYDSLDRLSAWYLDDILQKSWAELDGLGNDLAAGSYNAANEMTPTVGSSGYDDAGNMTTLRSGDTAVYDAWNRMVEVNDGQDIIQRNEYDGANRRIQIFSDFTGATPGTVQDDYYSGQQIIETHEDSAVKYQNVWSPRYIDSLILRDTLSAGQIVAADRILYLSDANYNVTGLVKEVDIGGGQTEWQVVERYTYTPYGEATFRNGAWTDVGSSTNSNATLYTGRYLDSLTSLYYYRARFYDAALERFISRDPVGYGGIDSNLYRYVRSNPIIHIDPSGYSFLRVDCWPKKPSGLETGLLVFFVEISKDSNYGHIIKDIEAGLFSEYICKSEKNVYDGEGNVTGVVPDIWDNYPGFGTKIPKISQQPKPPTPTPTPTHPQTPDNPNYDSSKDAANKGCNALINKIIGKLDELPDAEGKIGRFIKILKLALDCGKSTTKADEIRLTCEKFTEQPDFTGCMLCCHEIVTLFPENPLGPFICQSACGEAFCP